MPDCLSVSNRSIRVNDSVLDAVFRLLMSGIAHAFNNAFAILREDSFQEGCVCRRTLLGIKSTDSEHFVGPVKRLFRPRVISPTSRMGQSLRFSEASFAVSESVLRQFSFNCHARQM